MKIDLALEHDAFGRLAMTPPGGERTIGVTPVRCFPFTSPNEWISLCDERGRELYLLATLDSLSDSQRKLLEQDLASRELIPQIRKIHSVSPGSEPTQWKVATDRGETSFTLPNEDAIRRLGEHGALINDDHGVRYRILDTRTLDAASRRILNQYL